jgi:hypothetical protein
MTMDLSDPTAVLLATAEAFERGGIRIAAYGGLVLAAYGTPRETKDADLAVVAATGTQAMAALSAAGIESLIAFDRVRFGGNRVTRLTLLPEAGGPSLNTVDLVEPLSVRYAQGVYARALTGTLRGVPLRLVTPEDFVVLKVLSTRDRDLEDAATVLGALSRRIDSYFIEKEVAELVQELTEHDVAGRYQQLRALVGNQT